MTAERVAGLRRARASFHAARAKARSMGVDVAWDCEHRQDARGLLPGAGRHRVRDRQIARGGAVRRHVLDGDQDRGPARGEALRRRHPRRVPRQDARLQPVAVVQLGHHRHERRGDAARSPRSSASSASSSTSSPTAGTRSTASRPRSSRPRCRQDGMLALARLQRKFRLLESPYRTPQTLVGGPRSDAALMASSGRTATTKAMGKGSTQHQHLVQTEVPPRLLEEWLAIVDAAPRTPGSLRGHAAAAHGGLGAARAEPDRTTGEKVAERRLRDHPDRRGRQHPVDPRSEHLRRSPAAEAADDAEPALPHPPLPGLARCTTSARPTTTATRRRR